MPIQIIFRVCFFCIQCLCIFALPVQAERGIVVGLNQGSRVALVIGNADYESSPLQNPVNDARDMSNLLDKFGFSVDLLLNADQRAMEMAINDFYIDLQQSKVGLFYFAGHGVQVANGDNYLLPIGGTIQTETDLKYEAVHAGRVLGKMQVANSKMNIVILDACRNNPFKRNFRNPSQGLARMEAPQGTIVAYATAPGNVAAEGTGKNGVFTKHLLQNMNIPGLPIEMVLKETRKGVFAETAQQQLPWVSSSFLGDFYFVAGGSEPPPKKQEVARPFGRLTVIPSPADARVRIMNIPQPYRDGIELKPGEYHLRVDKQGYSAGDRYVELSAGDNLNISIELKKDSIIGRLFVQTVPSDAEVRLLNSDQRFSDGMELEAGRYEIEVSSSDYETKSQWINVRAGKKQNVSISLKRAISAIETAADPIPGKAWTEPITGMEFVWVPGGCYMMGSPLSEKSTSFFNDNLPIWQRAVAALAGLLPVGCAPVSRPNLGYDSDETPAHEVCVDGFWMGKYEVTIGQYRKFLQATDYISGVDWDDDYCPIRKGGSYSLSKNKFGRDGNQPMVEISWHGATAFAEWLSLKTGRDIRLPTEAEWEYAARSGGKHKKYSGGNNVDQVAWYFDNSGGRTHRVGTKSSNGIGLYDMSGNVWEWCQDVYDNEAYSKHTINNPVITSGSSEHVIRGGGWIILPWGNRVANRNRYAPEFTDHDLGFRLCFSRVR